METRDQGMVHGEFETALNTFYASSGYYNQFLNTLADKNGSSRFLEDAARLGCGKELEKMFATQYQMFQDTPNRLHDQGDYYSAEGYGAWAAALQQALMQSLAPSVGADEVIRIFPAWPKKWDVRFKLLAKGGFLVMSSLENEQIKYVGVQSQLGRKCRIRSPWSGNVLLYRNEEVVSMISAIENEMIEIDTAVNDELLLIHV